MARCAATSSTTQPQQQRAQQLLAAAGLLLVVLCCATPRPAAARPLRSLAQSVDAQMALPCAVIGGAAGPVWMNASATCLQFWPSPAAPIVLPQDTAALKYGQLYIVTDEIDAVVSVLVDRDGAQYPISASANPPTDAQQLERIWPLIIVQATLDATTGNVTSFTPLLYVPYKTVLSTLENTQFEGVLYNSDPRPVGPNETSYIRWSFGSSITVTDPTQKYGVLLHGTFDNLFRAVKDSNGTCRPALCADPTFQSAACQYYTQFFGNSTDAMTLNWDPNMHTPTDTELVPMFPAFNRQYMSGYVELYQFLKPYQLVPHKYVFVSHGNPMGVPQNFTGTFTPLTPVTFC